MEDNSSGLIFPTAAIVSAFVGKNSISPTDLPALIDLVHAALRGAGEPDTQALDPTLSPTRAQIRKSITPEALISFEDGRAYKTLKRHLAKRGMTPAAYKAKYGLPDDYPTTAPNYSELRSRMARSIGLGRPRKTAATPVAVKAKPKSKTSGVAPAATARRLRPKGSPAKVP